MNRLINKFYLVAIMIAITIAVGMFAEFSYLEKTVRQETQKAIVLERNYQASVIDNCLNWRGQIIKDASTFIATGAEDEKILIYLKALMAENPSFLSFYYGTVNNYMINASGWIPPATFDLRTRPWFIEATTENQLVYTEAFLNATGDQWILTIAQPVYNQTAQLLGVVAGDIAIGKILDMVNLSETKDNGYSFLIDSKGNILAHPKYPYTPTDETVALKNISEILSPSVIIDDEGIEETIVDGQRGYLAYQSIRNTEFILGSFIEISGMMNHSEQIWIIFLITTFSTTIIFLLLFIFQRRHIIKPIMSLNQDILSMPIGGEIDYQLNEDEKDIFFELRQTVNGLSDKLKEYFDKITDNQIMLVNKNKELEDGFRLRESMLEISKSIMKTDDLDRIYDIILENALKSIKHARLGSILKNDRNQLRVVAHIGYKWDSIKDFNIPIEDSFLYKATDGKMNRQICIDDLSVFDSFYSVNTSESENVFIQSTLTAPIYIGQELYGIISLDSMETNRFDDNDEKVMAFIQSNIEIAITKHLMFEKTVYLSRYDGLTGLYNRKYFEEFFNTNREKALRYGEQFNIVMFDINKLKYVNDHFGHLAGDAVIREFSKLLSNIVRKSDIIARYAGDEFMGMFFNSDKNALYERLMQLLNEMENNFIKVDNACIFSTFSFGIAEFGVDGSELDDLLRIADERMYKFKLEYYKK